MHHVWSPIPRHWQVLASLHSPFVFKALRRFLQERPGVHIVHSFGSSAEIGVKVAAWSERQGNQCFAITYSWDCVYEEALGRLVGMDRAQSWRGWITPLLILFWAAAVERFHEGRSYRRSKAVLVSYRSIHHQLTTKYGVDPSKVHFVPYAAETAFLPESESPAPPEMAELRAANVPVILSVSRHDPKKGIAVLLRALAVLHELGADFRACIVGEGYLLEYHRWLTNELGLQGLVRIPGFVRESYDYMRYADVFVLPSLGEGSGSMSMLEAMQASVPVVASRLDGIPEDVTDGFDAILVKPGDVAELAHAIRRLLDDPALRKSLAANGFQTFEKRFSARAMVESVLGWYERIQVVHPGRISVPKSDIF